MELHGETTEPGAPEPEEAPPAPGTTPGPRPTPEPKPYLPPEKEGEEPTPDEEPDPTPGYTRGPTRIPDPQHPEGLEGCKRLGMFRDDGSYRYLDWCGEAVTEHVVEACAGSADGKAAYQCGRDVLKGYDSGLFRLGLWRCSGIDEEAVHRECTTESWQNFGAVEEARMVGWERIRVAASQDPEVQDALGATLSCLNDAGYKDVEGLLFHWQHGLFPSEYKEREDRLTEAEKDLRERVREPSRECAHREGLFSAQDAAWAAEIRRLQEAEPQAVYELVREGLLEALERPGEPTYITGDWPPYRTPR